MRSQPPRGGSGEWAEATLGRSGDAEAYRVEYSVDKFPMMKRVLKACGGPRSEGDDGLDCAADVLQLTGPRAHSDSQRPEDPCNP